MTVISCRDAPHKVNVLPVADRNGRARFDPHAMQVIEEIRVRRDFVYMTIAFRDGFPGNACKTVIMPVITLFSKLGTA